jgi:hypothetical protein
MKKLLLALVLCGVSALASAQYQPQQTELGGEMPRSSVWIGNSFFYYNNGMPGQVGNLLKADLPNQKSRNVMITMGGSGFDWHDVNSYFRPNAVSRYSFDSNNQVVFNKKGERLFDVAVMMDCSQCPLHPQLSDIFTKYAKQHSATVRKYGAKPVLFMSWAYQDKPEMTAQLAEAYTKAGNDNKALVIPAGLAFARSIAQKPELNLYVADKRHPTLAGTYLAACTSYATLYKRSPVGNTYTAGLDADTAKHLQTVAWETVQDYFKP